MNKPLHAENHQKENLLSQRIVYDHMNLNGLKAYEIIISPTLHRSVKLSRQQYTVFMKNRKNTKESEKSR